MQVWERVHSNTLDSVITEPYIPAAHICSDTLTTIKAGVGGTGGVVADVWVAGVGPCQAWGHQGGHICIHHLRNTQIQSSVVRLSKSKYP